MAGPDHHRRISQWPPPHLPVGGIIIVVIIVVNVLLVDLAADNEHRSDSKVRGGLIATTITAMMIDNVKIING